VKVRRLTESGISKFIEFIDSLTTDFPKPLPAEILKGNETSEIIENSEFQLQNILPSDSRLKTSEYIHDLVASIKISSPEHDRGFWAWLSLHYFEQICPRNKKGGFTPGEIARWVPDSYNYRKYYRHLLAGPWRIYSTYKENPAIAYSLLAGPVKKHGDLYEQLASRQEVVSNRALIELSTRIYFDTQKESLKRGAGGKGPGSPRRLADIIQQFSRTWDLYAMTPQQLFSLLPSEFDKFKT